MFDIGEKIIYGKTGVCEVVDICEDKFGIEGKSYKLQSADDPQNIIYVSVNNEKVTMRKIISAEKAKSVIESLESYQPVYPKDDKVRAEYIHQTITSDNMKQWIQLLKGLYLEKENRIRKNKSLKFRDEKAYTFLENFIFGELAAALGTSREDVFKYIDERTSLKNKSL